jgi:hypothetical protein
MNENTDRNATAGTRRHIVSLKIVTLLVFAAGLLYLGVWGRAQSNRGGGGMTGSPQRADAFDARIDGNAQQMLEQGRQIFRFDTFGDEAFWTDKLQLHKAIEGTKLGGTGSGVSPKTALAVGLKVDMDALPAALVEQVKRGEVNLDDPATTLALIKLNAVLGVKGAFNFYLNRSRATVGLNIAPSSTVIFKFDYLFNHTFGPVPRGVPSGIGGPQFGVSPVPHFDFGRSGFTGSIAYVF